MTHILRLKKLILLAVLYFIASGITFGIDSSDWPFYDNPQSGNIVAYFYDSDFRNGGVTAHIWNRTFDVNGNAVDMPYAEWDRRPVLQMTGFQYEDENGNQHPLYRLELMQWFDYSLWQYIDVTHILFVQGNNDFTSNYEYNYGNVYSFGHETDYGGEILDLNRVTPLEEGKHTVYFAYRSDYMGSSTDEIVWGYYNHTDGKTGSYVMPKVHVWGDNGDVTPYMFNESLQFPSDPNIRYMEAKYPYGYSSFYEYTFYYFGGEPTGILFHLMYNRAKYNYDTGETTYGMLDYYTGDLEFQDGAVYYYDGLGVVTEPQEAEFFDYVPDYERTVYFADTDNWIEYYEEYGYNTSYLSVGQDNGNIQNPYIIIDNDFKKYIKINDKWCRVWKLTLKGSGYCENYYEKLKFYRAGYIKNRSTALLDIQDNSLYYYAGNGIPTPVMTEAEYEPLLVDELPEEAPRSATIYVNLGANQLMEEDLWEVPYCHPYKRNVHGDISSDETYSYGLPNPIVEERTQEEIEQLQREEMTMLAPGFYSYTIDDVTKIDDITLYYYAIDKRVINSKYEMVLDEDGNIVLDEYGYPKWEEVYTYEEFPNVFVLPASRSPHFDPTELTRYVFDIGVDCVHQSYLEYEQLKNITDISLDRQPYLYLAGNETVDLDNSGNDPILAKAIENDHGCFFTDFEVGEELPAVYKFSTVDVASVFDALGRDHSTYDNQRGWATYNQGIIGCHIDPTRADYEEWYEKHITRPEGAPSRMVSIGINQCMDYNNYCQYPWRVEYDPTGEAGVKYPGHYWFVVDFNEDDQTVVLLDFDPHPHLFSMPDNVRQAAIPSTEVAELLHDGKYAEACEHNGKMLFEEVNIASGVIEVQGTGNQQILDAGFDVLYTVFTEDGNILFQGKPEKILSDYMDLSEDTDLGVQGRFHYTYYDELLGEDVHKYFRTKYSRSELDLSQLNLTAPEIDYERNRICLYMANDESDIALGGAVDFKYSISNDYSYLPDYKVVSATVDGKAVDNAKGILLHKDHFINNHNNPWGNWLGIDADNPWQPHDGFSELVPENHWGNYIVTSPTGNMPVLLDQLMITDNLDLRTSYVCAEIDIIANYPFLSHRQGKLIEVAPLAAKKVKSVEMVPDDTENYRMVTVSVPTRTSVDFGDNVITGVEDINNDNVDIDGEPVYYNLSGIRIDAASLTPGIYLECRGSNVKKIIVR